tara:strand:- start:576 stop:782 length:207 start_codon:yes stop_codon:yes gene_type:complete
MKKVINNVEIEMTPEEVSAKETENSQGSADIQAELAEIENQKTLKASAKAKLIAGEPLTQDEANTIVL